MLFVRHDRHRGSIIISTDNDTKRQILYFKIEFLQRENVKTGIYSNNWTETDVKFKKLLLLAMSLHDSVRYVLRASPRKIINLQFFSSVIII